MGWIGKCFEEGIGKNRFFYSSRETYMARPFLYKLSESRFFGKKSILLLYNHFDKRPLSIWKGMIDEIRLVKKDESKIILLGMGCFTLLGGRFNSAPFCLWKDNK